jgi:replication factor C subunit 1
VRYVDLSLSFVLRSDSAQSAVEDIIGFMDEYFISREDFDTIIELGVGDHQDEIVNKKVSSATKSALTRKYGSLSVFVFHVS